MRVPEFPRELRILGQGSLLSLSGEKTLVAVRAQRAGDAHRDRPAAAAPAAAPGHADRRQLRRAAVQQLGIRRREHHRALREDRAAAERSRPARRSTRRSTWANTWMTPAGDRRGIFLLRVQAGTRTRTARSSTVADTGTTRAAASATPAWSWSPTSAWWSSAPSMAPRTVRAVHRRRHAGRRRHAWTSSAATACRCSPRRPTPTATCASRISRASSRSTRPCCTSRGAARTALHPGARRGTARPRARPVALRHRRRRDQRRPRRAVRLPVLRPRHLPAGRGDPRRRAIVRSQDWSRTLRRLPLRLEITDPRGTVIRRETFVPGSRRLRRDPPADARDVAHRHLHAAHLRRARRVRSDLIGSTTVQVRDFQPDRLRMRARFSAASAEGWVSPEDLAAHVSASRTCSARRRRTGASRRR